jgi:hypothetical protein
MAPIEECIAADNQLANTLSKSASMLAYRHDDPPPENLGTVDEHSSFDLCP